MLADQFDTFLIDLDGVAYLDNAALPGAVQALAQLRAQGKTVRFLTNDPRPERHELRQHLAEIGVEAMLEEIVTCGWATALHLRKHGWNQVSVVGSASLASELRRAGCEITETEQPQAVVVGCDQHVAYPHLDRAATQIAAGARFVATNADGSFPSPTGPRPATGAIVAALQAATGQRPLIVGKPHPSMFRAALDGLPPDSRAVMVGDSPHTDILGAHQHGLPAILISPTPTVFVSPRDFRTPDATLSSLTELFTPGRQHREWSTPTFPWPEAVKAGVAAVVFNHSGNVLLQRRADNGLWGLPSGHVEPGETVDEAVTREVAEETGLQVQVSHLIGVYSHPNSQSFAYPSGQVSQFITSCFRCQIMQGDVHCDEEETLDAAFFPPDELPAELLPMHPQWLTDALANELPAYIR